MKIFLVAINVFSNWTEVHVVNFQVTVSKLMHSFATHVLDNGSLFCNEFKWHLSY